MSLFPLLSAIACPLSVSTLHCTVSQFRVTIPTSVCYSLSTFCQYVTLYRLSIPCRCSQFCLLQPVHCLSVHYTVPSLNSVSLFLLLSATACPLSLSTSHCTVSQFYITIPTSLCYSLSTVCPYVTFNLLTVATHLITLLS